jgi:hypothetical protein
MPEYKVTVIDYRSGYYFEVTNEYPEGWSEDDIGDDVMNNVGVEVELVNE